MRTRNDNQHLSLLSPPQVMSHLQAQLIFDCQLVNQFQNNHKLAKLLPNDSEFESTVRVDRLPHRKWKETKQQPGNMLGCCLVSLHFLTGKLSMRTVLCPTNLLPSSSEGVNMETWRPRCPRSEEERGRTEEARDVIDLKHK